MTLYSFVKASVFYAVKGPFEKLADWLRKKLTGILKFILFIKMMELQCTSVLVFEVHRAPIETLQYLSTFAQNIFSWKLRQKFHFDTSIQRTNERNKWIVYFFLHLPTCIWLETRRFVTTWNLVTETLLYWYILFALHISYFIYPFSTLVCIHRRRIRIGVQESRAFVFTETFAGKLREILGYSVATELGNAVKLHRALIRAAMLQL